MSNIKKVFIASLVVLATTLFFWLFTFLKTPKTSNDVLEKSSSDTYKVSKETSTPSNTSKVISISDDAVVSPVLSNDNKHLYYFEKDTGKVFKMNIDGSEKSAITDKEIPDLRDAFWSKDQAKAIVEVSGPSGEIQFFYHNFDENSEVPIKKNLDNVSWQLSSNRIFYKYFDPKTKRRTLNTADPDGGNWKKLTDLEYRDISIAQIPGSSAVSFWNKADAFSKTSFVSMPIGGGERRVLFSDKFGADYLWNNAGQWVLVSHSDVQNGSKMQLALINQNGGEYRNLDFSTFVSKCTWSKDDVFLYCSLPEGMPEKSILPNDYNENKFSTIDTFWKIDVKTGERIKIEIPENTNQRFDAKDPFLDQETKYLFFINKIDGKLYRVTL